MIFVGNAAFCQKSLPVFIKKPANNNLFSFARQQGSIQSIKTTVAPNFYASQLGFFCKQEIRFERATKIPFKFRLGTVQQCDWMEGKPNTGYKQ